MFLFQHIRLQESMIVDFAIRHQHATVDDCILGAVEIATRHEWLMTVGRIDYGQSLVRQCILCVFAKNHRSVPVRTSMALPKEKHTTWRLQYRRIETLSTLHTVWLVSKREIEKLDQYPCGQTRRKFRTFFSFQRSVSLPKLTIYDRIL